MIKKGTWPCILLLSAVLLSACDAWTRDSIYRSSGYGASGRGEASNTPSAIIDRLLPDEGLSRKRLRAVIEATMRVSDVNRSELPEQRGAVRRVLQGLTPRQLERIEAILPEVEANPKLQWED